MGRGCQTHFSDVGLPVRSEGGAFSICWALFTPKCERVRQQLKQGLPLPALGTAVVVLAEPFPPEGRYLSGIRARWF